MTVTRKILIISQVQAAIIVPPINLDSDSFHTNGKDTGIMNLYLDSSPNNDFITLMKFMVKRDSIIYRLQRKKNNNQVSTEGVGN